jgi:branched-chain amino acid transport system substrate-binding protein
MWIFGATQRELDKAECEFFKLNENLLIRRMPMKKRKSVKAIIIGLLIFGVAITFGMPTRAEDNEVRIGVLTSKSGVLSQYGEQDLRGFILGFDYATNGTNTVLGKKIKIFMEDDGSTPQIGLQKAVKLLAEDNVDILCGVVSSGIALGVMNKAKEFKKVYMIGGAAVDQITGSNFNKYTFRAGRSLGQCAVAGWVAYQKKDILAVGKGAVKIAYLAPDYAGGRFGIESAKEGLPKNWTVVQELYAPLTTTDFTPYLQKIKAAKPQILGIITVGANFQTKLPKQIQEMGLDKNMAINVGIADFAFLKAVGASGTGWVGECLYYYELFDNPVNKWLVENHQKKYGSPPDLWTGNSFAAAIALIEGIKKAKSAEPDALINALEGLEFWGPTSKTWKYRIRPADHQTMIGINFVELKVMPGRDYAVPTMVWQSTPQESETPVTAPGRENYAK